MIVLCCPRCRADVPDKDLSEIIRFYNGDQGIGVECPGCGWQVVWKMKVWVDAF